MSAERAVLIRFIYAYFLDGRAVYVGSAVDVAKRDREHCCKREIPFDKFIGDHGRENFAVRIVEGFRADTIGQLWAMSAARENHWMDLLDTFRTPHGHNYSRATVVFESEEHQESALAALTAANRRKAKDPEYRATMKEAMRCRSENPKWKAMMAEKARRNATNPKWIYSQQKECERRLKDPIWREKNGAHLRSLNKNSDWLTKRGEARWSTPGAREKNAAQLATRKQDPEFRARLSCALKRVRATPEYREQQSVMVRKVRAARKMGYLPFPVAWLEKFCGFAPPVTSVAQDDRSQLSTREKQPRRVVRRAQ